MKATRFHEYGGPDKLRYEEVPDPVPSSGEVLVRVRACAVNHIDLDICAGTSRIPFSLPHTLGIEVAGEIAAVDSPAAQWKVGDRVTVNFVLYCGTCSACRAGNDNICETRQMMGVSVAGGYAEYVLAPARCLLPLPSNLSYEEAAATQVAFGTAWHMLIALGKLLPGETVLVNSAGSGVGSAAVQIAKLVGARVLATVGSDEKRAAVAELGADVVWNHQTQDVVAEVGKETAGRGVGLVFEHVGGEALRRSLQCVGVCGRIVTCGAHAGEVVPLDVVDLFRKQVAVIGCYTATSREIETVLGLVAAGKLKPVVYKVLPLAEAAQAHELMAARKQVGKIVLVP